MVSGFLMQPVKEFGGSLRDVFYYAKEFFIREERSVAVTLRIQIPLLRRGRIEKWHCSKRGAGALSSP